MPIEPPLLPRFDSDALRELDYQVMRHAFDSHNELGRLCDESVYEADLASRLNENGISARRQVPVQLTHAGFVKEYFLDLVVADSFVYELKTVAALDGAHQAQLINYLHLTNTAARKLINFRPGKVESRFVNSPVDHARRLECQVTHDEFDDDAKPLRDIVVELLGDWGMLLDLALIHSGDYILARRRESCHQAGASQAECS